MLSRAVQGRVYAMRQERVIHSLSLRHYPTADKTPCLSRCVMGQVSWQAEAESQVETLKVRDSLTRDYQSERLSKVREILRSERQLDK